MGDEVPTTSVVSTSAVSHSSSTFQAPVTAALPDLTLLHNLTPILTYLQSALMRPTTPVISTVYSTPHVAASAASLFSGTALLEQFHCYRPPLPTPTSAALCQAVPAPPTTATTTSHDTSDFDLYTSIQSVTTSSYVPEFMRSRMLQAAAARTGIKPSSIPISNKPRMSTHASSSATATKPRHVIKHTSDISTTESKEVNT